MLRRTSPAHFKSRSKGKKSFTWRLKIFCVSTFLLHLVIADKGLFKNLKQKKEYTLDGNISSLIS